MNNQELVVTVLPKPVTIDSGKVQLVRMSDMAYDREGELNDDGSLNCDYGYDIIMAPDNVGDRDITDEQGEIFEKQLGEAIIELLWESAENENRNSDTEKSTTE